MTLQQKLWWPAFLLLAAPLAFAFLAQKEDPTYQGKPLSTWLKQLRSDKVEDRQEAAVVLDDNIGPEGKAAVPALIEALKDEDFVVHGRAPGALGRIGSAAKAAAPALIATFKDKDKIAITRAHAAE